MNHKYRKPKKSRAGCLLCKPHKINGIKSAERAKAKREAFRVEKLAY